MKPAYIIGLVAILCSIVLGVMNRSKYIKLRNEKDESSRQTHAHIEKAKGLNTEAAELIANWDGKVKERQQAEYGTETEKKAIAATQAKTADTVKETEALQKFITETNEQIAKVLKDIGSPKELTEKRDALKKEVEEQEKTMAALDKEITMTEGLVAENARRIGVFREQQTQRDKTISLSTREGSISAVNPDWAFVVVNMGKTQGVSEDSRLLVKRGAQLIGKLKIVRIDNNSTLADIDMKSLKAGNGIQPGDQVIFDSTTN